MIKKEVEIITEQEVLGKDFKIYGTIDNPLFLASDVADWIEHSQVSKMIKSIDNEEKLMGTLFLSGQNRETWFLTEDGLYEVLMQSRKPIAKKFKKEVKKILKDIRKHGMYMTTENLEKIMNDPDAWITMLSEYKKEKEGRVKAEQLVKEQKPKVEAFDELMYDSGLLSINDVAKEVGIGEYKLFEFLRKRKVLFYNQDKINIPYERFRKEGKFIVREKRRSDGCYYPTTYATPTGLNYIRKLLKKHNPFKEVA